MPLRVYVVEDSPLVFERLQESIEENGASVVGHVVRVVRGRLSGVGGEEPRHRDAEPRRDRRADDARSARRGTEACPRLAAGLIARAARRALRSW